MESHSIAQKCHNHHGSRFLDPETAPVRSARRSDHLIYGPSPQERKAIAMRFEQIRFHPPEWPASQYEKAPSCFMEADSAFSCRQSWLNGGRSIHDRDVRREKRKEPHPRMRWTGKNTESPSVLRETGGPRNPRSKKYRIRRITSLKVDFSPGRHQQRLCGFGITIENRGTVLGVAVSTRKCDIESPRKE